MSFVAYKSSAGSGKTFTLVKEYIKLCIVKPESFRHILAITFTNKAANEMKERVISYLTQLLSVPADTDSKAYKYLLPELIKETNLTEKEISRRSKLVLDSILHNYSDFAIGTIDSFVHRIIRIFAHDLKIPLNFEVEMDVDKLLSEAIDLMISKAGTDEQLTKILIEFTENKTDEEKSWNIENDLTNFARQFVRDDSALHIENIRKLSIKDFLEVRKKLLALSATFENSISKIAAYALKIIQDNDIPLDAFYHSNNGIGKYFEKLSKGIIDKGMPGVRVLETLSKDSWCCSKCSTEIKGRIDSVKETLAAECNKIIVLLEKNYKNYVLYNLILANIYPVAVLSEIEKVIEEIKKENNILPISEFNEKISRIVVTQPVPFIYERIGEKFQNYLIDEFQDTSALQWINLLPLIENSLGYDYFNLIVGDGKQAIYRWRGGDVEQFAMLPEIPKAISDIFSHERAAAIKRNYNEKFLSSNFRSKAEIVDFNNKFFKHINDISPQFIQTIYAHCEQKFDKKNTGGYVQIDFTDIAAISEDQDYAAITNKKIHETIHQVHASGYNHSDIAILCRRKKEASGIARFLISQNISVISDESLLLNSSLDVNFLLAFAYHSVNRYDTIAKYRILHYLMSHGMLNDNKLFSITCNLHSEHERISNAKFHDYLKANHFTYNFNDLVSMPVFEFFKELTLVFGLSLINNPHLQFFLDAILDFSSKGKNSVSSFLEWWDDEQENRSVIIPEGTDAVRIMTIHKSKGLEFPVVIYPFAFVSKKPQNDFLWIQPEIKNIPELKSSLVRKSKKLEETNHADVYQTEVSKTLLDTMNIMYVVLTRASERLYIFTQNPSEKFSDPKNIPGYFASFLDHSGMWKNDESVYSFGTPEKKDHSKKEKNKLLSVALNDYKRKERKQTIHLKKKSSEIWDAENPERNIEWGNTVHYVLSKIAGTEDVDRVLTEIKENGFVSDDKIDELKSKVQAIIAHPLLSEFFKPSLQVLNESEIICYDGTILRPDRIILENKKATVIDYKTGRLKEEHIGQINEYATALQFLGYNDIRKILVYVSNNQVEEIS
ncbi:MAG: UvrD-helicase domain-containing protein [Bacteroidota bacterium]